LIGSSIENPQGDHITRHTNSLTTRTTTSCQISAETPPKKTLLHVAPCAALFPAEDDQDIAAKTRHPPTEIVTSFLSPGKSTSFSMVTPLSPIC
jgi:hypothetical protein